MMPTVQELEEAFERKQKSPYQEDGDLAVLRYELLHKLLAVALAAMVQWEGVPGGKRKELNG